MEEGNATTSSIHDQDVGELLGTNIVTATTEILDQTHREAFRKAIHNILKTNIAEFSYAQIIDGLPIAEVAQDSKGHWIHCDHPIRKHRTLCHGVMDKFIAFRQEFNPRKIPMPKRLLEAFNTTVPGDEEFLNRLIELCATCVHQIAVDLYRPSESAHKNIESFFKWVPPPTFIDRTTNIQFLSQFNPSPTLFLHFGYEDPERYPNGVADIVGFWAEQRILGGVALFRRGRSGLKCGSIYFHSSRDLITDRLWRVERFQVLELTDFLLQEPLSLPSTIPSESHPLPVFPSWRNQVRVPVIDAYAKNIYRESWFRYIPTADDLNPWIRRRRRTCVRHSMDFPPKISEVESARKEHGDNWERILMGEQPKRFP